MARKTPWHQTISQLVSEHRAPPGGQRSLAPKPPGGISRLAKGAFPLLAIAIVAALAVGVFAFGTAQPAGAQSAEPIEYKEGGTGPVATFIVDDPDEDDEVTWGKGGDDEDLFDIKNGVLTFKEVPDFEAARDRNEDNTYEVTVTATDEGDDEGENKLSHDFKVEVKVANVDEPGKVTWEIDHDGDGAPNTPTLMQFQTGAFLEATVTDGDVPASNKDVSFETRVAWQWYRSPDKTAMGTAIDGATDPFYTVTAADVGQHIRVEATYVIGEATETASLPSDYPVLAEAASDADAPRFAQANITRKVNEGEKGRMVGDPVTATGGHGALNYDLTGTDSGRFDVDQKTGQITTKVDLDHEATAGADDGCVAQPKCMVEVTAWDASGTASDPAATVTITLVDVDDKPEFRDGEKTVTAPENSTDVFGDAYTAVDPDGDRINYSLRGDDGRYFNIDRDGLLSFKEEADYEDPKDRGRDNVYNVTVRAIADGSRLYADMAVKVMVTDVPEPPKIVGMDSFNYKEDRTDPVVTFTADDPEGDKIAADTGWAIVEAIPTPDNPAEIVNTDFADADHFDINQDGVLIFDVGGDTDDATSPNAGPDFEAPPTSNAVDNTYKVVVSATDATGEIGYKKVTVKVTNAEEDPVLTWSPDRVQYPVGATIVTTLIDGDEATETGNVPPSADTTYQWHRLSGKNSRETGLTAISATDSGTLADYPVAAADVGDYLRVVVTYTITGGTPEKARRTTENPVVVADTESTAAPVFETGLTRNVAEGKKGAKVGDPVTATGGYGKLTYTLAGTDAAKFKIDKKTGQITTTADLDFEADASTDDNCTTVNACAVEVTATDASGTASTAAGAVTISITGVNEGPEFKSAPDKEEVAENKVEVTTGGEFEPTDPEGDRVTLTLKRGADSGLFRITNSDNLEFRTAPDYEKPMDQNRDNIYDVTVRASDGSLSAEHTIRVTVTNVNEKPEIMKVGVMVDGQASVDYAENGTDAVDTYTASETTAQLSLTGADAAYFMLEGTGHSRMLKFMSAPDYENPMDADMGNTYEVTVKAMYIAYDQTFMGEQAVMVMVTNVDEAPEITGDSAVSYAENGMDAVGTYMATDPEGMDVTLSLSGADMGAFDLSDAGALTFKTSPDYEAPADADTDNVYMVTVMASDGTNTADMAIMVTVTDVDENTAPMFDGETATREVPENSAAGTAVGDPVAATDAGDTLTYMLSGDDAMYFAIDNMGQITVGADAMLDYEMKMSYMVMVTATDTGSKMDTISVTIMVTNVDEAGMVALAMDTEQPTVGEAITASVTDPDGMVSDVTWQWSSSADGMEFMDIADATSEAYTPGHADAGMYLGATASYTDPQGSGKSAMAKTSAMVIAVDDNPGTLTLSAMEPMVGTAVTAMLTDPDEVVEGSVEWQWSRDKAADGTFTHISAEMASYTPVATDVGYYLKITATYTDGHGSGKSLMAVAEKPVPDPLVVRYDDNGDRMVQKGEVIAAINDYLEGGAGAPSKADVIRLISMYLDS